MKPGQGKTVEIIVEVKRVDRTSLRKVDQAFCLVCDKVVRLIDFSKTIEILKTNFEDVCGLANQGRLHRIHNENGRVMICSDSLFLLYSRRKTQPLKSSFLSAEVSKILM